MSSFNTASSSTADVPTSWCTEQYVEVVTEMRGAALSLRAAASGFVIFLRTVSGTVQLQQYFKLSSTIIVIFEPYNTDIYLL